MRVRVDSARGGLTVVLAAPDQTGLLADVVRALTGPRLTIRSASVRTVLDRAGPQAVQTWQVETEFGYPPEAFTVRSLLLGALAAPWSRPILSSPTGRIGPRRVPAGFVPPIVTVVAGASAVATVLQIRAHDAAGLLQTAVVAVADARRVDLYRVGAHLGCRGRRRAVSAPLRWVAAGGGGGRVTGRTDSGRDCAAGGRGRAG